MEPWSLAVPDWRERIRTGRSLLPDLPQLNRAQANRAIAIFNKLRLPDVVGTPALAEAGADWFREIVGALHGSFDPVARERMIREIFLLAPKKSSKTSYAAALMVTTLLMNERPRAEFLLVAPTVSLAHIAFSQALGMVDKDPDGFLRKRLHVQEHLRKITDRRTKATLEIKAFDTTVLTGVKPTGVLLDELHEIAKVAAAERIIGQLRGGLLPNPEGFLVFITTQSDEPPRGAFRAELMVARAIRDPSASILLAWAVGNARVEPKGNAIVITKQASGTAKIDPLMAMFNAVALMAMNPQATGRSYLRSSELLVL